MDVGFKVVFTGALKPGADPDAVAVAFGSAFGVSEAKAKKLMRAGREVELKKDLDADQAQRAKMVLEGMGMLVRVETMAAGGGLSDLALEPLAKSRDTGPDSDATLPEGARQTESAARPRCPKCGSERIESDSCLDCGIIVSKYLAIQERRGGEVASASGGADGDNPYAAPKAELVVEDDEGEMTGPETVPAAHGWAWLVRGFWHFKQSPLAWILVIVIWIALAIFANLIPVLGPLAISLFSPAFMAGFMIGSQVQEEGGDFQVAHLFAGFSDSLAQLVLVGVLYLLGMTVIMFAGVAMLGGSIAELMTVEGAATQDPEILAEMMKGPLIVATLVMAALMVPLLMAYWFAPALVVLEGLTAFSAMKLSFLGCLKNVLPFLVYGLLALLLLLIAIIPFGLGLLIVMPVMMASIYVAFRDIYYG